MIIERAQIKDMEGINKLLKQVYIPSTLNELGRGSVYLSDYIEVVYYGGSKSDWRNFCDGITTYYNTNLTNVKNIVVTGGSLIHTKRTEEIAAHALYNPMHPMSLRPMKADVWVDRTYILAAMGLLSGYYPEVALRIMKKELEHHGYSE